MEGKEAIEGDLNTSANCLISDTASLSILNVAVSGKLP